MMPHVIWELVLPVGWQSHSPRKPRQGGSNILKLRRNRTIIASAAQAARSPAFLAVWGSSRQPQKATGKVLDTINPNKKPGGCHIGGIKGERSQGEPAWGWNSPHFWRPHLLRSPNTPGRVLGGLCQAEPRTSCSSTWGHLGLSGPSKAEKWCCRVSLCLPWSHPSASRSLCTILPFNIFHRPFQSFQ